MKPALLVAASIAQRTMSATVPVSQPEPAQLYKKAVGQLPFPAEQGGGSKQPVRHDGTLSATVIILLGMGSAFFMVALCWLVFFLVRRVVRRRPVRLTNSVPGSLADAAEDAEQDRRALEELDSQEQELYFQAKEFIKLNPPISNDLTLSQALKIREKGVSAWEFKPHVEVFDEVVVANSMEVEFRQPLGHERSIQTNYPIPRQNDVYYFETKLYQLAEDGLQVALGVSSFPYPYFRLPGRHTFSVCYDSTGSRRYNQPFALSTAAGLCAFPKLTQGDVVGCGIRTHSRTVFWTRNGKKLSEAKIGGHVKLPKRLRFYPTLGATGPCKMHVNVGQMGYVFIEANVKKWGFGPLQGSELPPPMYRKFNKDVLIDSSDLDPEDLNLRNGDFPPDFYAAVATPAEFTDQDSDDEITLDTMPGELQSVISTQPPPHHPPSYVDVLDAEQTEAVRATNAAVQREMSRQSSSFQQRDQ